LRKICCATDSLLHFGLKMKCYHELGGTMQADACARARMILWRAGPDE